MPAIKGHLPDSDEEVTRKSSDEEPLSMLAFKVMNDPFVGSLTFCRIYSGKLEAGTQLLNTVKGKKERAGRMLQMHSNSREEIKEAYAGDIIAVVGLKDTTTGDTLCDAANPVVFSSVWNSLIRLLSWRLSRRRKLTRKKWVLRCSVSPQKTHHSAFSSDEESGQTIIKGMGELHLDILVDRMKREFKVEANIGQPQVAYRETITRQADIDYTHKKQSGGSGQFARIKMHVIPQEPGRRL